MPIWAPSPTSIIASGRLWQMALWRGARPGILLQMMLAPKATTEDRALRRRRNIGHTHSSRADAQHLTFTYRCLSNSLCILFSCIKLNIEEYIHNYILFSLFILLHLFYFSCSCHLYLHIHACHKYFPKRLVRVCLGWDSFFKGDWSMLDGSRSKENPMQRKDADEESFCIIKMIQKQAH